MKQVDGFDGILLVAKTYLNDPFQPVYFQVRERQRQR